MGMAKGSLGQVLTIEGFRAFLNLKPQSKNV